MSIAVKDKTFGAVRIGWVLEDETQPSPRVREGWKTAPRPIPASAGGASTRDVKHKGESTSTAVKEKKLSPDTRVVITNAYRRAVAVQLGTSFSLEKLSREVGKSASWMRNVLFIDKSATLGELIQVGRVLGMREVDVVDRLSHREDPLESSEKPCFDNLKQLRTWAFTENKGEVLYDNKEYIALDQPTPYIRSNEGGSTRIDSVKITNAYRKLVAVGLASTLKGSRPKVGSLVWGGGLESTRNRLTASKRRVQEASKASLLCAAEAVGVRDQAEQALNIRQAGDEVSVFKTLTDAYHWGAQALTKGWTLEAEKMVLNEIDRQLLLDSGYELEDQKEETLPPAETEGKQGLRYRIAGLERARDLLTQEIEAMKVELSKSLMEVCG